MRGERSRAGAPRDVTRRQRIGLKAVVWAGCLTPLASLLWRLFTDPLVTNPIDVATDTLGDWTLRILLLSLTMTPLRILFGLSWPVTLRRLLGLFAFAHALLHFSVWLVVDHFFDWPEMAKDVVKAPRTSRSASRRFFSSCPWRRPRPPG